ncbi:MAG: AAA domain (dynein-related subfamily) [Methanosaeta sp. PtaB.Bin018]|nr:gas vesicle protein GvpN [Methanothrix sp.]OPX75945.1 MAG: AAA domain (dynein-related subfamily) [Methanosaeta sp. PtaB.Bin018]
MKYIVSHPRRVRGESVHQTASEKRESEKDRRAAADFSQPDVQVTIRPHVSAAEGCGELLTEEAKRKAIEEAYLKPEANHFISTPEVKEVENRMMLWLQAGYPVHLIGPTGCGKTSLAIHVASELGRPIVWINGDESITTTDLIGGYSQIQNESVRDKYIHNVFKSKDVMKIEWVDNPLSLACKYGYTLIYNEFSRTKPASNNILLSVFEERILELPTKFGEERYIKVHPEFKAILTSNSIEYAGIHRPQDALLDRMVGIYTDYYSYETEVQIVMEHTGITKAKAERIASVVRSIREKLPDAQKPGTRACIMIAKGLKTLNGHGKIDFEQLCIDVIANKTSSPKDMAEKKRLVLDSIAQLG